MNIDEALREIGLDIKEGADMIMIKPGMPYLDIIRIAKDNFKIPIFSYQVSGEYSLLKNAIKNNLINNEAILESLISLASESYSTVNTPSQYAAVEAYTGLVFANQKYKIKKSWFISYSNLLRIRYRKRFKLIFQLK